MEKAILVKAIGGLIFSMIMNKEKLFVGQTQGIESKLSFVKKLFEFSQKAVKVRPHPHKGKKWRYF